MTAVTSFLYYLSRARVAPHNSKDCHLSLAKKEQFAKAFAESGASVALADWNENATRAAADELNTRGHKAISIRCNVADDAEASKTVETFGRLDAAYNNAGVQNVLAETADTTREDYDRVMGVNLRGVWPSRCRLLWTMVHVRR